jgi:hypothetical protein
MAVRKRRLCTKVPTAVYKGVAACTTLLHPFPQWQAVSARGLMLLGSARVSKGEEQETRMQEATSRAAGLICASR